MFSFFTKGNAQYDQLATEFSFNDTEGKEISLADYKKKVILVGCIIWFANRYPLYLNQMWGSISF